MPRPITPKCCLYLPRGLQNFSFVNKSFLTPSILHLRPVQGFRNGHLVKVIVFLFLRYLSYLHIMCKNATIDFFWNLSKFSWGRRLESCSYSIYTTFTRHKDTPTDFSTKSSLSPTWTKELLLFHLLYLQSTDMHPFTQRMFYTASIQQYYKVLNLRSPCQPNPYDYTSASVFCNNQILILVTSSGVAANLLSLNVKETRCCKFLKIIFLQARS